MNEEMNWWEIYKAKQKDKKVLDVITMLDDIDGKETEENIKNISIQIRELDGKIDANIVSKLRRKLKIYENRIERNLNESFGSLVKHLRQKAGYTLQEVQDISGISASYIHRIEKGERKAPSFKIIEKLADVLNADRATLLALANLEVDENIVSIDELLYANNFTVDGQVANKKQKTIFVKMLTKIVTCEWSPATKHLDSGEILMLIEELKTLSKKD